MFGLISTLTISCSIIRFNKNLKVFYTPVVYRSVTRVHILDSFHKHFFLAEVGKLRLCFGSNCMVFGNLKKEIS